MRFFLFSITILVFTTDLLGQTVGPATVYVPSDLVIKYPVSFPDEVNQGVILTGDCRDLSLMGSFGGTKRCVFSIGPDGRERWRAEFPMIWRTYRERIYPAGPNQFLLYADPGFLCSTIGAANFYLINRLTGDFTDLNPEGRFDFDAYSPFRTESAASFLVSEDGAQLYYVWDGLRRWAIGSPEDSWELVTTFMDIPAEVDKVAVAWQGSSYVLLLENELLIYDVSNGDTRQIELEGTAKDMRVLNDEIYLIVGEELRVLVGDQVNFLAEVGAAEFAASDRSLLLFDATTNRVKEFDPTTASFINWWQLEPTAGVPVSVAISQGGMQITRPSTNVSSEPFLQTDRVTVYQAPASAALPVHQSPFDVELVS
ncbi:MAG: hypothetical protein AAF828_03655, partial [Bacteroidota bacterium]